ncbi:MAG TPA: sensor histidine kinase, partial [Enterococcus faecalis]|nr:sensor histidine kinase [Enterococcus faecalis]
MKRTIKKELEGPSLTIKWSFASSFFIFVVFTIFAVITYKSSVSLIVAKEKENVEATIAEVTNRLANANENLTVTDVFDYLKTPSERDENYYNKHTAVEGSFMEMDSFISELGQPELYLSVYDTNQKLVFKTQNEYDKLLQLDRQLPVVRTVFDKTGFYSVEPIFSKETREKIGYIQAFYELSSFYEIRNHLLLTLVVLEVISLIVSSVLGFILSSYFLKPLKVLRDTMDTIRKDPQSDVHMPEINT